MIPKIFVCTNYSSCGHESADAKPQEHYDENDYICSGTLKPFISLESLTKVIEERIDWVNINIKKECEPKTEVLFELQSLLTHLEEMEQK